MKPAYPLVFRRPIQPGPFLFTLAAVCITMATTIGAMGQQNPNGPAAISAAIASPGSVHPLEGKGLTLESDRTWKKADLPEFTRVLSFHFDNLEKGIITTGFNLPEKAKGEISFALSDPVNCTWQVLTASFRLPGSKPFTLTPKGNKSKDNEPPPISNDFLGAVGPGYMRDREISLYLKQSATGWVIKIGDELGAESELAIPFTLLPQESELKPWVSVSANVAKTNPKASVLIPEKPAAVIPPVKGAFGSIQYQFHSPKIESGKLYPLVVCLHGAGGVGIDNRGRGIHALGELLQPEVQAKHPCFLLAPQKPEPLPMWVNWNFRDGSYDLDKIPETVHIRSVHDLILKVMKEYPIDPKRIYVTGQSMGGYGTWDIALRHPELFGAVVPLCGGGSPNHAARLKDVAVWAFHGDKDDAVPVSGSRDMAAALNAAGATKARYTELPGEGHVIMEKVWNTEGILEWLFAQKRD